MTDFAESFDPTLDLELRREVDVSPNLVWRAWTEPDLLKQWFCPKPWQTTHVELDLRPGGRFRTVMRGPAGEEMDNTGCYLMVVPNRLLAFTDALGPGFRPTGSAFMSASVSIEPKGSGTLYVARAVHKDPETRKKHEEMGFHQGWATALDQLVALAKTL